MMLVLLNILSSWDTHPIPCDPVFDDCSTPNIRDTDYSDCDPVFGDCSTPKTGPISDTDYSDCDSIFDDCSSTPNTGPSGDTDYSDCDTVDYYYDFFRILDRRRRDKPHVTTDQR